MHKVEKLLHGVYAIAIAGLIHTFIENSAKYMSLTPLVTFMFVGLIGVMLITLGLFIFKKGLSFGLTFGGIICVLQGSFPFWNQMTVILRFLLAVIGLMIVVYALYRLYGKKGNKSGKK